MGNKRWKGDREMKRAKVMKGTVTKNAYCLTEPWQNSTAWKTFKQKRTKAILFNC